jgi:ATPase family associated with various cellular activities (AAA)
MGVMPIPPAMYWYRGRIQELEVVPRTADPDRVAGPQPVVDEVDPPPLASRRMPSRHRWWSAGSPQSEYCRVGEARPGEHPLLFQLLNEMDGLSSAADVTFLLTTNRADLLEPALAARPGRVDLAAELPPPDADARRRLIRLYQGNLVLDQAGDESVIERTEGVTAAFLKELLRKAALISCEEDEADEGPVRVTDAHLTTALDQLLDSRNQLTRALLGGEQA